MRPIVDPGSAPHEDPARRPRARFPSIPEEGDDPPTLDGDDDGDAFQDDDG